MISTDAIRNRLAWADEMSDVEILQKFAAILYQQMQEIPEEDPNRQRKALHVAICAIYRRAWRCGCMAAIGAEPGVMPRA